MILLGVDIGGTKIAAGVVDSSTGAVLYSERTPTNASEGGPAILARALAHAKRVVESADVPIESVGIGAGGQIDYRTGVVLSATDILPGWAGTRLAEAFAEAFHVPAYADNDVNAFALGELRYGAGRGATDAVFLALGTGVGGAIVTNGKLHRGKRGTGGELGHMLLYTDYGDGGMAPLEYFTSGSALSRAYKGATNGRGDADGHRIESLALQGDANARRAIAHCGECLGMGLASLANILDTERFVIGGGLADLGDRILEPARTVFAKYALPIFRDTKIMAAELGPNSSVVGAACVALAGTERDYSD